ncbi:MAG: hypothetical protein MI749_12125 [Desulfovibrionales bacterium]|nr:hypothetical protein [Desulfovibrionales bacterium]
MTIGNEVWRWNVNPVWHHHCSMVQEAVLAKEAIDDFTKYHHLRGCFYFGIGALEAFLNEQMRAFLSDKGQSEKKIFKKLRYAQLKEKRDDWPAVFCEDEINFPSQYSNIISLFNELRGEITHSKAKDHSIYKELDEADPSDLVEAISCSIVYIYEVLNRPFPYWLLGWNYVGMNGDCAYPTLSNNQNGFVWSLSNMGFSTSPGQGWLWEKENMTSVEGFVKIKTSLDSYSEDIEPLSAICRTAPRLTRRWWDRKYILERSAS